MTAIASKSLHPFIRYGGFGLRRWRFFGAADFKSLLLLADEHTLLQYTTHRAPALEGGTGQPVVPPIGISDKGLRFRGRQQLRGLCHAQAALIACQASTHFAQCDSKEKLERRRAHLPYGCDEGTEPGKRLQGKYRTVEPSPKLPLQIHHHRAGQWIVISSTAKDPVDGQPTLPANKQSTRPPLGHKHRPANPASCRRVEWWCGLAVARVKTT